MVRYNDVDWIEWTERVHAGWAVPCGWWTDLKTGKPLKRDWLEACMLVVTEVAEAMEGSRKGLMDDKLPHREMVEVEMADVIIRLCDMMGGFNFRPDYHYFPPIMTPLPATKGGCMLHICRAVCGLAVCNVDDRDTRVKKVICYVFDFCNEYGYDLMGAVEEKHEYNKTRDDHKLENRKLPGGKSC